MNAKEDIKLNNKVPTVAEHTHDIKSWGEIPWDSIEKYVWRLQQRIFRAESKKQHRKVKQLQRLLLRSKAALLLSIRQVTQINKGKRTAGVDGFKVLTEKQRLKVYDDMKNKSINNHKPSPTLRIYIPKKNGKLRPLSIPTIRDRVYQNIAKLVLEPEWEAKFESISYGFRPKRGCHDAIEAIYSKLSPGKKQWIFEGDFKGCFDNLSHDYIMTQIKDFPSNKVVNKWLKTGYIDKEVFNETNEGTPQGGIISPLLANIALHGMENALGIIYRSKTSKRDGLIWEIHPGKSKYSMVRYADDFVVMCDKKEDAEDVYRLLEPYLKVRGLELAPDKTKITHVTEGFDFLGFNVRRYATKLSRMESSKLLIKPSKDSIKKCKQSIKEKFEMCNGTNVGTLIKTLKPVITGTGNYWSSAVSKEIFSEIDRYTWIKIRKFLNRLHPKKSWKWKYQRYFKPDIMGQSKDKWLLTDPVKNIQINRMSWIPIVRHAAIKYKNTPYDSTLKEYFNNRDIKEFKRDSVKLRQKLAKRQNYKCPICRKSIIGCKEGIERHHWHARVKGGDNTLKNQSLLHTTCHIVWHQQFPAKGKIVTDIQKKQWIKFHQKILRNAVSLS